MLSFKFVASSVSKRGFENGVKRNFSTARNIAKPLPTFNQKFNTTFRTNTNISSILIPNKFNNTRFYSTPTNPAPAAVPPPVPTPTPTPEVAPVTVSDIPTDADVTKLIDVLNTSLAQPPSALEQFLYPTEWWRSLMTFFHDNLGMPWWATLCSMAVITRLFTFPLAVRNMRNAPAMKARNEEMSTVMTEMRIASQLGDQAKAAALQKKMAQLWNPRDMLINMLPMPIFITAFIGIQGIVTRNIDSLHHEGLLWFQDLAVADPYYGLPLASLIFGGLSLVFVDAPMAQMRRMLPIMLILVCVGFYATRNVPAGLHVYWSSAAFIGLLQVILLRKTPLKRILKIPDNPHTVLPTMPSIFPKAPEVKPAPPKLFNNPPTFNMYKNKKGPKTSNVDNDVKK